MLEYRLCRLLCSSLILRLPCNRRAYCNLTTAMSLARARQGAVAGSLTRIGHNCRLCRDCSEVGQPFILPWMERLPFHQIQPCFWLAVFLPDAATLADWVGAGRNCMMCCFCCAMLSSSLVICTKSCFGPRFAFAARSRCIVLA